MVTENVLQQPSQTFRGRSTDRQKQTPSGVTNVNSSKAPKPKNKESAEEVQPSPRTRHNSKILQNEEENSKRKAVKDKIKTTVVKMKETQTTKNITAKDKKTEEIASSEVSNSPGGRRSSRKRKINPDVEAFLKGRTLQFETEENEEQQETIDEVTHGMEKKTTVLQSPKRLKRKSRNQSDSNCEFEEVPKAPKRPKGQPVKIISGAAYKKSYENDRERYKKSDVTQIPAKMADSVSKMTNDHQPPESVDVGKPSNTDPLHPPHASKQHNKLDSSSKHEEAPSTPKNDTDEKSKEERKEVPTLREKKSAHTQDIINEISDTNEEKANVKSETGKSESKEKLHDKEGEIPVSRMEEILDSEPVTCSSKSQSNNNSDADNPKFNVVFDEESGNYQLTMSIDSKPSAKLKVEKPAEKAVQESEVGNLSEADEKLRDDSRTVHTCPVCRKQFLALQKFHKHIVGTNCTNVMLQTIVTTPEDIRPLIEKAGKVTDSNQCPNCEKSLYCIEVSLVRL